MTTEPPRHNYVGSPLAQRPEDRKCEICGQAALHPIHAGAPAMDVTLELAGGAVVAHITIPRFELMPGVIVWGQRTFVPVHEHPNHRYREVFSWWMV
jgi:hypothetical protein